MNTTLEIQNLKYGGCEASIYSKLSMLKNIKNIFVNVDESTITFKYDTMQGLKKVKEKLSNIGYPVLGEENKLMTKATSYVSCVLGRFIK